MRSECIFGIVSSGRFVFRGGLLLLVSLAFGALCMPSASADSRDGSAQRLEAIRVQMEKGQALYVTGDYNGAAQIFEAGYKSYPYSAFLFNAGVCYQKLNDIDHALEKFHEYNRVDPDAPDAEKVKQRIAALEAAKAAAAPPTPGADGGVPPTPPVVPPTPADDQNAMKSLVVIETEPPGAPLKLFVREDPNAQPFNLAAGQNAGWKELPVGRSPLNLTLDVGHYHVVVDKFRDFNVSEADMDVSPGHVHQFKANLSQGEFMSFLRVSANVNGAYAWLDDPKKERPIWGTTPHGELVGSGKHVLLVEAPGFESLLANVELSHGEQKEMEIKLARVGYGILRVDSNAPDIKVRLDDQPKGTWRAGEAALDIQANSGQHRLTVVSDGRKTFEGVVEVPRGLVTPVHVKMIPRYPRGAAWTQAIVGAAFLGAAAYFGTESNHLNDDLKADRKAGVLQEDDSRASRGKIYSIAADSGFVVAGVLGVLATYNFIKDPLPPSSVSTDKDIEFDDPMKARPTALLPKPKPRQVVADTPPRGPEIHLGTTAERGQGGLFIGGSF